MLLPSSQPSCQVIPLDATELEHPAPDPGTIWLSPLVCLRATSKHHANVTDGGVGGWAEGNGLWWLIDLGGHSYYSAAPPSLVYKAGNNFHLSECAIPVSYRAQNGKG